MKTICFVTTGDIKTNATSKRALGMANPLSDLGWRVHIIMEDTPENRHRASMECDGRTEVHYFAHSSAFGERRAKAGLLQSIRPDYLYLSAFVFRNIVPHYCKCIKIVEHSELMSHVCNRDLAHKAMDTLLEYLSLPYADGVVNASCYLQGTYLHRANKMPMGKRPPMLHLPYAYNPGMMQEMPISESLASRYKGKTVFMYLGAISDNYGIYTLIEAARLLYAERRDFCLIALGHGKDFANATTRIKSLGLGDCVEMRGFVSEEDIPLYFSLASAFISPMNDTAQDWARCPSKLYMYLPYGKPVITCRIGEPQRVFGKHGVYYAPGNASELSKRMAEIADKSVAIPHVNPLEHTWEARARQFDQWISSNFQKRNN